MLLRLRRPFALLGLLSALATWAFVSSRPSAEDRAQQLLERQVARWEDPETRAADIAELQAMNPEWDFMHRTFLALALVDRAIAHPEEAERWLPVIDELARTQIADQAARGDRYFLLPYVDAAPFLDPSGRSVFVDGEIALVLGARRLVRDDPALAAAHHERVEALAAQFERSPALLPESYPNEAWLFCNTNALVAIRMADLLDGTDHQGLIDRWLARARAELVDERTGMLGSEYTWSGGALDGPEGSSAWLVATNLRVLDPAFAEQQYVAARAGLVSDVLGFGFAREWPDGGTVDVDSGPIVPLLDASPSSSGFALLAASAFGDAPTRASLVRSLGAADLLVRLDPRMAELAANPMGDVIVLHALTFGPLWEELGGLRPLWISPDVMPPGASIASELAAPLATPVVALDPSGAEVTVRSCAERARRPDVSAWDEYRTWDGASLFLRCFALSELAAAAPARVSAVGDFRLDLLAVDALPPTVGWLVSPDAEGRARAAEAAGRSWAAEEPGLRATRQDDVTLQVAGEGFVETLQLLARADFDGDGWEDLLLAERQAAEGGSLRIVRLQVVTRADPDGPMRVVRTHEVGG